MPKNISAQELDALQDIIAAHTEGATLEMVAAALSPKPATRTLQRRLAALVGAGRVVVEGEARATRYRVAAPQVSAPSQKQENDEGIALSSEGARIRQIVRGPIHTRNPVGYNREWLDAYRPNETAYLPLATREHLARIGATPSGDLPAGTYARQILNRLLIDLSWNSSRLEGNTYSLLETERLLQLGEGASGKDALEAQMILNHKAAIEMLVEDASEIRFNRYTLLNLHGLLSDNLLADSGASGRLRAIPVSIGGTVFHPLETPQLISECFDQILQTASAIRDPFEQSFFVMVHLPYLQPFEDVNKRTSRLAANIPLIRLNLCPLSFVDVPSRDYVDGILGVYELNRVELLRDVFVWAYERSAARYAAVRRSLGEPDPFRLRYRARLIEVVGHVVRAALDKVAANRFIIEDAATLPPSDREKWVEVAQTELQNLHEGNFARFRVRPSEFEKWRDNWH